jgi:hypothetical protein
MSARDLQVKADEVPVPVENGYCAEQDALEKKCSLEVLGSNLGWDGSY